MNINGLYGRIPLRQVIVLLIFRAGLFKTVELQDRSNANFPDALLQVRFLAAKLPAAKFAFHLDVCSRHGNKWGKGGFTAKTSIFKSLKLRFVSS